MKQRNNRSVCPVVVMTNEAGCEFDIMEAPAEGKSNPFNLVQGIHGFRMNVEDIQAAYVDLKA